MDSSVAAPAPSELVRVHSSFSSPRYGGGFSIPSMRRPRLSSRGGGSDPRKVPMKSCPSATLLSVLGPEGYPSGDSVHVEIRPDTGAAIS